MFCMIALKNSVCASDDLAFFCIQQICCYDYCTLEEYHEYIDEFRTLFSENLTFLDSW